MGSWCLHYCCLYLVVRWICSVSDPLDGREDLLDGQIHIRVLSSLFDVSWTAEEYTWRSRWNKPLLWNLECNWQSWQEFSYKMLATHKAVIIGVLNIVWQTLTVIRCRTLRTGQQWVHWLCWFSTTIAIMKVADEVAWIDLPHIVVTAIWSKVIKSVARRMLTVQQSRIVLHTSTSEALVLVRKSESLSKAYTRWLVQSMHLKDVL